MMGGAISDPKPRKAFVVPKTTTISNGTGSGDETEDEAAARCKTECSKEPRYCCNDHTEGSNELLLSDGDSAGSSLPPGFGL